MCSKHYQSWRKRNLDATRLPFAGQQCATDGCGAPALGRCGLCPVCYRRRWEQENAERRRERRATHDDLERQAERKRLYRATRPEVMREASRRWVARHPEAQREMDRRYRQSPRGRVKNREKGARRRALMRAAFVEIVDYAVVLMEHGMFCHICSMVIVDTSDLHFDHVIPLAAGGMHEAANIRPAHAVCNLKKGPRVA
jgi:5-methylcytosine-specific restriction endonuclease McrA